MQVERMRRAVAKEPVERIRRSTSAPQGAFGVADRSGEVFADAAKKAAAQLEAVAKRRQEDWDKARVNEAVSRYLKWDQETRFDPQKGLMFTTGANAKGLYDRSLDVYENQAETMAGELENERQRMMFREAVIPHARAATFALSRQEASEVRKWNAEQAEERLKNEAVTLAAGFDSPEAVDAAISSARQVNLTINGDQGKETNDKNEMDVMRRLIGYGLDSLLNTDPLRAEAMLERFKKAFDGVSYEKLRQAVSRAALPVKAQDEAEELLSQYGEDGMTEALAAVREAHAGPEAEDYAKYVKSVFSEAKAAREERRAAIAEGFYAVLNGGGSFASAQRFIDQNRAVLGEKNYHSYMDLAERLWQVGEYAPKPEERILTREEMVAAQNLYNEAKEFAMSEAHPTPDEINERYGAALKAATGSDKAFKDIIELTSPKAGGVRDRRDLYSADKVVNQLAEDAGVTRTWEEYSSFNDEWRKACKAKADEKGSLLTQREAVEPGRELIEDKVILGRSWFRGGALEVPEYQLRRLGIRAEDVKWDAAGGEYVVERDGQFYALEEDEDFYELKPLKGGKRNFEKRD